MGSRRLLQVAVTMVACLFAASAFAAAPAPKSAPAPASHRAPDDSAGSSVSDNARMSRAAATDMLLTLAWSLRGTVYHYGGHTPERGFDCSGLVRYVFRHALGIALPHRARAQFDHGEHVARDQLKPGDLVFFRTHGRRISHVGIYLDDGRFLDAPRTGEVVRVDRLDNPYWSRRYAGARRIPDLAQG